MDEAPSTPVAHPPASSLLSWLAVCFIATTAMSLASAHAPPRVRLIGMFSVAFGLLAGWLIVRLALLIEFKPSPRLASVVAGLMSCLGLIGGAWETWRLEVARQGDLAKERVAERLIEQSKTSPGASGTIPIDSSPLAGFRWYISRRTRQLGRWPSPWPELFWLVELLLGTAASVLSSLWGLKSLTRQLNAPQTPVVPS